MKTILILSCAIGAIGVSAVPQLKGSGKQGGKQSAGMLGGVVQGLVDGMLSLLPPSVPFCNMIMLTV